MLVAGIGIGQTQTLVGQRLKLKGQWDGRRFSVTSVQLREPKTDTRSGRVIGMIEAIAEPMRMLRIGPILVELREDTRFEDLSPADLVPGASIEVKGRLVSAGHLLASSVKRRYLPPGRLQMRGAVTSETRTANGSRDLTVLGVTVELPPNLDLASERARRLSRSPDDRRPSEQLTVRVFGRPLTIGGELDNETTYRKNVELEDTAEDDLFRLEQELQLEIFYRAAANLALFLETEVQYSADLFAEDDEREVEWAVLRGQTWLYVGNLLQSAFSLQLGRQNLEDKREWWWDQTLDALRLHYDLPRLHAEVTVAQEIAPFATDQDRIDPRDKDVLRLFGHVSWRWRRRHRLEAFVLYQHDHSSQQSIGQLVPSDQRDESDADVVWFGIRVMGRLRFVPLGRFNYWLDSASVIGNEILLDFERIEGGNHRVSDRRDHDILGWAIDIGVSWQTALPGQPTLTLAYALGSGSDQPEDGTEHAFRQTGLQDNNDRFGGVDSFRYYGELLRPELSNLQIWTMALGVRLLRSSSVELLYHLYRQVEPVPFLRRARIRAEPEGEHRAIGQEWDVVIGIEEWEHVEVELIGAVFRAGSAYGSLSGKIAYVLECKIELNF